MQWQARTLRGQRGDVCSFGQVRRWADWADPPYPSLHVTSGSGLGGGQGARGRREDELAVSKPRMADGGWRMKWQHYLQQCRLGGWLGAAECAMPNSGVHYQHNAVENT